MSSSHPFPFTVLVNGKPHELNSNKLEDFIHQCDLPEDGWAMALNGEYVPKNQLAFIHLKVGDEIDLVTAAPGG